MRTCVYARGSRDRHGTLYIDANLLYIVVVYRGSAPICPPPPPIVGLVIAYVDHVCMLYVLVSVMAVRVNTMCVHVHVFVCECVLITYFRIYIRSIYIYR